MKPILFLAILLVSAPLWARQPTSKSCNESVEEVIKLGDPGFDLDAADIGDEPVSRTVSYGQEFPDTGKSSWKNPKQIYGAYRANQEKCLQSMKEDSDFETTVGDERVSIYRNTDVDGMMRRAHGAASKSSPSYGKGDQAWLECLEGPIKNAEGDSLTIPDSLLNAKELAVYNQELEKAKTEKEKFAVKARQIYVVDKRLACMNNKPANLPYRSFKISKTGKGDDQAIRVTREGCAYDNPNPQSYDVNAGFCFLQKIDFKEGKRRFVSDLDCRAYRKQKAPKEPKADENGAYNYEAATEFYDYKRALEYCDKYSELSKTQVARTMQKYHHDDDSAIAGANKPKEPILDKSDGGKSE